MKKITLLLALVFSSSLMFGQIYFEDDFDGSGPGIAGWSLNNVDGLTPNAAVAEFTDAWIQVDRDGTASGGGNYGGPAGNFAVASTSWYTPAGTSDDWLITPQINLPADATLYWDAKAQDATYADGYEVRVSTTGTAVADFTDILLTVPNAMSDWESLQLDLSAYTGQDIYIAFRNNSTDQFVLLVDNVEVSQTPSCVIPTDLVAEDLTSSTFEISWMDANSGTPTWEFEIGAEGFTQGGGGTLITNVMSSPYTFMSLSPNSSYDFYMRTNCGGANGESDWIGPFTFRTLRDCTGEAISTYYTNNFLDETILDCFEFEDIDGLSPSWTFNTGINDLDGDGTTDNFLVMFPQAATETEKDDWLFSPQINMTVGNDYPISVIYNAFDFNTVANESFELYIVDDQSSTAATQILLGTYSNITQAGVFGDTGGNDMITQAYTAFETFSPTTDGAYYVAVKATSTGSPNLLMVLDIIVDETLSVDEFESNNFSYTYNKNTDQLTLESSNMAFNGIEMYSILGQNVISRELSSQNEVIDLSGLNDGIYLATVTINGNSKTIKILKQ